MVIPWYLDALVVCFEMMLMLFLMSGMIKTDDYVRAGISKVVFLLSMCTGIELCNYIKAPAALKCIYILCGGVLFYYYKNRNLTAGFYYATAYIICLVVSDGLAMWIVNILFQERADLTEINTFVTAMILSKTIMVTMICFVKQIIIRWKEKKSSVPWALFIVPNILNLIFQMISAEFIYAYREFKEGFSGMLVASMFILVIAIFYNIFIEYYINLSIEKQEAERQALKTEELKKYYLKR